jgi:hypothetical protein
MLYLDLNEIEHIADGLLVRPRTGIVRFRRMDYLGDPSQPLADEVKRLVAPQFGDAPVGPIRLLTTVRTFGRCFNPVSFYYCFDHNDERLVCLVADVMNTPWRERHAYIFHGEAGDGILLDSANKALHVSPYMDMDQCYECRATIPGSSLTVFLRSVQNEETALDATLNLERRTLTTRALVGTALRPIGGSRRVLFLIYLHAGILRIKGIRMRRHP